MSKQLFGMAGGGLLGCGLAGLMHGDALSIGLVIGGALIFLAALAMPKGSA